MNTFVNLPADPQAAPPPLPVAAVDEIERAVTRERMRLLSIAYYISGILGALCVSILLIHFCVFAALSFMPPTAFQPDQSRTPADHVQAKPEAPPLIIFRIAAGAIGLVILFGWTLGGLTFFAGRCISKRKYRSFVLIMAGVNCLWIPYGTILGVATFVALGHRDAKLDYPG